MKLEDVILAPDTLANQPAATAVPVGTLYTITNSTPANLIQRSNGTTWDDYSPSGGGGATAVTAAGTLTSGEPVLGAGSKAVAVGPINLAGGATFVTGDLPLANLAQGSALSVLGVTGNATADNASIAAGSDHQVLRRSGTALAFGQVNVGQSAAITGILPVANGGTGTATGALFAEVTITNAQWIGLPTAGKVLVAAPGAGFYVSWSRIEILTFFTGGAYTGAAAISNIIASASTGANYSTPIQNDNTTTPALTCVTRLNGAASRRAILLPYIESIGDDGAEEYILTSLADGTVGIDAISDLDDKALTLFANNGAVDFGGGNAANTAKVRVFYTIQATT